MHFLKKIHQLFDKVDKMINENLLLTVIAVWASILVNINTDLLGKSCESFAGFTVPCEINIITVALMLATAITLHWLHIYSYSEIVWNGQTQIFIFLLCALPIALLYFILQVLLVLHLDRIITLVVFWVITMLAEYAFFKRLYKQIGLEYLE